MTTPLRNRRTFTILVAALALTSLAALAAVPVAVRRAQDNQVATAPLPRRQRRGRWPAAAERAGHLDRD